MKLILSLLLFSFCIVITVPAQNERTRKPSTGDVTRTRNENVIKIKIHKTDAQIMNLKGRIKSITEKQYKAVEKNSEIVKADTSGTTTVSLFNKNGDIISSTLYNEDGSQNSVRQFEYVKPGMIKKEEYSWKKEKLYANVYVYEYDENNYLINQSTYDEKGLPTEKFVYKYYFDYRLNEYKFITDTVYAFDYKENKLVGMYSGKFTQYTFDSDTNIVAEKSSFTNSFISRKYNSQKQIVYSAYLEEVDGRYDTVGIWTYEYDPNGNMISEVSGDRIAGKWDHTYDSNGNWTKRIAQRFFEDGNVFYSITERKIEYF